VSVAVPVPVPVPVPVQWPRLPPAEPATLLRLSPLQKLQYLPPTGRNFEKTELVRLVISWLTMGARNHRELEAWQLANAVRIQFHYLLLRPEVRSDFEFCSDTRRAARSACRNLTEGFYRWKHPQFAHFVNITKGSLGELFESLDEGRMKGYLREGEYAELHTLVARALEAARGLHNYLSDTPTQGEE
jgi:four helix bundle protein